LYHSFVSHLVSFVAITLCVASQGVFNVVSVYFVIDSVRKLLDTLSYHFRIWYRVRLSSTVNFCFCRIRCAAL